MGGWHSPKPNAEKFQELFEEELQEKARKEKKAQTTGGASTVGKSVIGSEPSKETKTFIKVVISGFGHEPTVLEIPTWVPPFPRKGRVVFPFTFTEHKRFPREGLVRADMLSEQLLDSLAYSDSILTQFLRPEGVWLPEPWVQLSLSLEDPTIIQLRLKKVEPSTEAPIDTTSSPAIDTTSSPAIDTTSPPAIDTTSSPDYVITKIAVHVIPTSTKPLLMKPLLTEGAPPAREPVTDIEKALAV